VYPQQHLTRRAGLRALAGVLAAAAAACQQRSAAGPASQAPQPSAGPVTVRPFLPISDATLDRWQSEIVEPYRQRRPNVTIDLISTLAPVSGITTSGTLGVIEKMVAMIAAGDPPDIYDLPRTGGWMVRQGFADDTLNGLITRDKFDTKQFNQNELEYRCTYQGKLYHLPWRYGGNALVLIGNRDLMAAQGVQFPEPDPARAWVWSAFV
jgi:ABC-type glycerol-3-phosphate transport system substrate-binding protein